MKKSILEIYALMVCLITSIWSLIAAGIVLYSLIRISNPEFTMSNYEYGRYQSNDRFSEHCCRNKDEPKKSEEEITKMRTEGFAIAVKGEARDGMHDLIRQLIALLLNGVAFYAHWKLSQKARGSGLVQ